MFCETADTDVDKWNEMHMYVDFSWFHQFYDNRWRNYSLFHGGLFDMKITVHCSRQLIDLNVSNLFWFIPLCLPIENKNKYLIFKIRHVQINELPSTFVKNICLQKKWFGADELTIKEWRRKHLETGWKNYDIYSCIFGPPAAAYVPVLILHLSIVCKAVYLGAVWCGSSVGTVQWCSLGYSVSMLKMNCQKQLFQNINFQQLVKSFGNQRSSCLHRLNVNRSLVSSNKQKSL